VKSASGHNGDADFFRLAMRWASKNAGELVTTRELIRMAERISGEQLDDFFETWLFTPEQPSVAGAAASLRAAPSGAALELQRLRVLEGEYRR
jgi:aminopeptidase N